MSTDLASFAIAFRDAGIGYSHLTNNASLETYKIQEVTGLLWFRLGQLQVELFMVPPNYTIPEHTHPNVESYEMYIGGDISFSKGGRWVTDDDLLKADGITGIGGALIHIKTNDMHGGSFGPNGGVFMSIQKWAEGVEPHSVAYDYVGVTMGEHHTKGVVTGVPETKKELTWKDAASLEEDAPTFQMS